MSSGPPRNWFGILLAAVSASLFVGCDTPYDQTNGVVVPPTAAAPATPVASPIPARPNPPGASLPSITNGPRNGAERPAFGDRTSTAPPPDRPSATPPQGPRSQVGARLSAGVALPQSLPTGTAMGMSVDYVLVHAEPPSGGETVWVIEAARGAKVDVPVRLGAEGSLMEFFPQLKPEDGPFRSYLAVRFSDGRRVPFSDSINMASP